MLLDSAAPVRSQVGVEGGEPLTFVLSGYFCLAPFFTEHNIKFGCKVSGSWGVAGVFAPSVAHLGRRSVRACSVSPCVLTARDARHDKFLVQHITKNGV